MLVGGDLKLALSPTPTLPEAYNSAWHRAGPWGEFVQ